MTAASAELNSAIKEGIKAKVGLELFTIWFGPVRVDAIDNEIARLSVPTIFLKHWISAKYQEPVLTACQAVVPTVQKVQLSVRSGVLRTLCRPVPAPAVPKIKEKLRSTPAAPKPLPPQPKLKISQNYGLEFGPFLRKISIAEVQQLVADTYGKPLNDLLLDKREPEILRARQIAMTLARQVTTKTLVQIATAFHKRDTTVYLAEHHIRRLAQSNQALRHELKALRLVLLSRAFRNPA